MKKIVSLFLFCLITLSLYAQESRTPQLRCIYVKENGGGVSLYFIPITDSINFQRYKVYYADNQNGPYSVIDNNMTTANTDCFDGIDSLIHRYYFVQAVFGGNQVFNSDTLKTLQCTLNNPGNGTVQISWNDDAPSDPLFPTASNQFVIMRKQPNDVEFRPIGTAAIPTYNFVDTTEVCNDYVSYRVQLTDQFYIGQGGNVCRNSSTIATDRFENLVAPQIPILNQVTVDYNNDLITLHWDVSSNTDVNSYVIFHQQTEADPWIPIDTVYGRTTTSWVDLIHSSTVVNHYRLSARDSCGNASAMTLQDQQNMILHCTMDGCLRTANLSWSPYVNMRSGLERYVIYYSENGAPWQISGEVDANASSFVHHNLVPNSDYVFRVRAVGNDTNYTADSRIFSFTFNIEENLDFAYVSSVSVEDNSYINVQVFTSGTDTPFERMEVYRRGDNEVNFVKIGEIPYLQGIGTYTFSDYEVDVNKHSYYYKVVLYNLCAPNPFTSNTAHSILLQGMGNAAHINTLQWVDYDDEVDTLPQATYAIYRKTETDLDFGEIANHQLAMGLNSYADDVSLLHNQGADFSYKIAAEELITPWGESCKSFSNEVVLTQSPTLYIPNAFMGMGNSNRVFMPISSFVSTQYYELAIYNRWGVLIFISHNPTEGWDGTLNGQLVPAGVYVYRLTYLQPDGTIEKCKGSVTFVR